MSRFRTVFGIALLLGVSAVAYSQEPEAEHKPPKQEEPRRNPDAAPQRQEEPKPQKQQEEEPKAQQPGKQEESKLPKDSSKAAHEEKGQPVQQGHARPAGKSAHIPEQKFKESFGRPHSFAVNRVINQRTIVPNQTRFVYTGYTFVFVDPWPAEWAFTDDCYIDYVDDEYFLFDVLHPGVRVALLVVD